MIDTFTKRMKRESGETPDVFIYDKFSDKLKNQLFYIIEDTITNKHIAEGYYKTLVNDFRREYGLQELFHQRNSRFIDFSYSHELKHFFLEKANHFQILDILEHFFKITLKRDDRDFIHLVKSNIKIMNERFLENDVGYFWADSKICIKTSDFLHSEAVIPTLVLLRQKGYESAQNDFLAAHQHFRQGNYSEAITSCGKAFEDILKIICNKYNWIPKKDTARSLIDCCKNNGLFPISYDNHLSAIVTLLESGIPIPRNDVTHGSLNKDENTAENELAAYVVHMTASTILFLCALEVKFTQEL